MRLTTAAFLVLIGMGLSPPSLADDAVTYAADIRLFVDTNAVRIGTDPDLDGRLDDEFLFLTGADLSGLVASLDLPYAGWANALEYTGNALRVRSDDGAVDLLLAVGSRQRPPSGSRSPSVRPIEGYRLTRYYGFSGVEFAGWEPPFLPLSADCGMPGIGDETCDSTGTGSSCSVAGCGTNVLKETGLGGSRSGTTEGKPSACSTSCKSGELCCAGCLPHPERNLFGIETHRTYYAACTCCK